VEAGFHLTDGEQAKLWEHIGVKYRLAGPDLAVIVIGLENIGIDGQTAVQPSLTTAPNKMIYNIITFF